jgi:threonylcarbamoyladenosine tRNA methylthiotransferase MtaB
VKFKVITLGCKVNQFESQALAALLEERGHKLVTDEPAEAYIINTCAVTAESSRKSRQAVRRAMGENPLAITAVCGCWPQISPEEAKELGTELVFGSADRRELVNTLEQVFTERKQISKIDDSLNRHVFEELPSGSGIGRTRAMLKVQDGCQNFCTYCIIPFARGPVRSMKQQSVVAEVKRLSDEGYRELVITGIEISSYGNDLEGTNLIELVGQICLAAPNTRIRLGSLEPRTITEDFCQRLSVFPNLCHHFHLSLQSGSDTVLKRMGRRYTPEDFFSRTELLRRFFPNCGITTDLIVGFPGETEAEFEETLSLIEKCALSAVHVFPYSKRPGTKAAQMEGQLTSSLKKARAKIAVSLAKKLKANFLHAQLGSIEDVLVESSSDSISHGFTGNYCEVRLTSEFARNEIISANIVDTDGNVLIAEAV